MSVSLTAASSQYLKIASGVVTSSPFTYGIWFNVNDTDTYYSPLSVHKSTVAADFYFLQLRGPDAGDYAIHVARQNAQAFVPATTTSGYLASQWHMLVGVETSSSSRAVYLDGQNKGTSTQNVTPAGLNETQIGRNGGSSPANYFDGKLAYAFFYNYAMNDAQVAALYAAQNPLNYDAGNLISCWPLTADYNDAVGSNHMTAYNTPSISAENPFSASVGPRNLLTLGCG